MWSDETTGSKNSRLDFDIFHDRPDRSVEYSVEKIEKSDEKVVIRLSHYNHNHFHNIEELVGNRNHPYFPDYNISQEPCRQL